jgi:hypothetical protein
MTVNAWVELGWETDSVDYRRQCFSSGHQWLRGQLGAGMKNRSCQVFIISLTLCAASLASFAKALPSEQTRFSAENSSVTKPSLPEQVTAIPQKDLLVLRILENEGLSSDALPAKWFSASAIHLRSMAQEDLIAVGQPPLAGGNTVPFWIFVGTSQALQRSCRPSPTTLR